MERKQFKINIQAPREKVWEMLWNPETYRQWTTAFTEGSFYESDLKPGSKVLFLDSERCGMVSKVREVNPPQFMSFEHLGEVVKGVEDTESERVKAWAGSHENYTLNETESGTDVTIDIDLSAEFAEMFNEMWPKALAKLKEISEAK